MLHRWKSSSRNMNFPLNSFSFNQSRTFYSSEILKKSQILWLSNSFLISNIMPNITKSSQLIRYNNWINSNFTTKVLSDLFNKIAKYNSSFIQSNNKKLLEISRERDVMDYDMIEAQLHLDIKK